MEGRITAILSEDGYLVTGELQAGAFGPIYKATKDSEAFRIKVSENAVKQFKKEEVICSNNFTHADPVVQIIHVLNRASLFFSITRLHGPDVVMRIKKKRGNGTNEVSIQTSVTRWAPKMLTCVRILHEKGIIHRNITANSFSFKNDSILIRDLEFAKEFRDPSGVHVDGTNDKERLEKGMDRTFKSVYAHKGQPQSRRDDLQSLAYVLYSLMRTLPWIFALAPSPPSPKKSAKLKNKAPTLTLDQKLIHLKSRCTPEVLSRQLELASPFAKYLRRVLSLSFEEEPEYQTYLSYFHPTANPATNDKQIASDVRTPGANIGTNAQRDRGSPTHAKPSSPSSDASSVFSSNSSDGSQDTFKQF